MATQPRPRRLERSCAFCEDKSLQIDYKNTEQLKAYVSDYGRITPRYLNGNCARHQRMLSKAIKLARFMALLPYVGSLSGDEQ